MSNKSTSSYRTKFLPRDSELETRATMRVFIMKVVCKVYKYFVCKLISHLFVVEKWESKVILSILFICLKELWMCAFTNTVVVLFSFNIITQYFVCSAISLSYSATWVNYSDPSGLWSGWYSFASFTKAFLTSSFELSVLMPSISLNQSLLPYAVSLLLKFRLSWCITE